MSANRGVEAGVEPGFDSGADNFLFEVFPIR
jgi:hypothetical protein